MKDYKIIKLTDNPKIKHTLAKWFCEKWNVPEKAYLQSMNDCIYGKAAVPQWYYVEKNNIIIGGLGVIENDFHSRTDLSPNICAVYVEESHRGNGIAGQMLKFACEHMKSLNVDTLYLLTDHMDFYEKYGWQFLCMVQGDGETTLSRMYVHKQI